VIGTRRFARQAVTDQQGSRHLFDLGIGSDNLSKGDRYKVTAKLTAVYLTNKVALYNFLSTFSGTHFVTPRSYQVEVGFMF
jgi:hypothetical protein